MYLLSKDNKIMLIHSHHLARETHRHQQLIWAIIQSLSQSNRDETVSNPLRNNATSVTPSFQILIWAIREGESNQLSSTHMLVPKTTLITSVCNRTLHMSWVPTPFFNNNIDKDNQKFQLLWPLVQDFHHDNSNTWASSSSRSWVKERMMELNRNSTCNKLSKMH